MHSLYNVNSLVHWDERQIETRERATRFIADELRRFLKSTNRAWEMERVEAPVMLPRSMVNANYGADDLWVFDRHDEAEEQLVARPETTAGTYAWMVHRLGQQDGLKLPWCVWQAGLSFRAERDQVLSHVRLKQFHQFEAQCAYTADTANDYQQACLEPVRRLLATLTGLPTRLVDSDRLPSYSTRTVDVEVDTGSRWMEVCSISSRTDFPVRFRYQNKKKNWIESEVRVLEIAVGLDRLVYARGLADALL
jgi:glycyl-tRNA synthetase